MPRQDDAIQDTGKQAVVKEPSIGELLEQKKRELAALTDQLIAEENVRIAQIEASKSPLERRLDRLEAALEHIDTQVVRLAGHSYRGYIGNGAS